MLSAAAAAAAATPLAWHALARVPVGVRTAATWLLARAAGRRGV